MDVPSSSSKTTEATYYPKATVQ